MAPDDTGKHSDVYLNEVNQTALCLSDAPDMIEEIVIAETGGVGGAEEELTGERVADVPITTIPGMEFLNVYALNKWRKH